MRGRTLDNAFVILDEAQNTTLPQIKMFLTRMGRNAKFIVTGDVTQIDLPRRSDSGLMKAMATLEGIEGIGTVRFDRSDIVRHPMPSSPATNSKTASPRAMTNIRNINLKTINYG